MITAITLLAASFAPAHASSASGTWTYDKDGSAWEVYADAIEDYPGTSSDLALCIDGAESYISWMNGKGYTNSLMYTDNSAWPTDFEEGRGDDSYNDVGDYNYFSGHGSSGTFWFGFNPSTPSDLSVTASETYWGEIDAEVVALDSCNSVDSSGRAAFATANLYSGLHYVVGFESLASDTAATAAYYGYYLYNGYSVRDAWHYGADVGHGSSNTAAYLRFYNGMCETYYDTAVTVSCDPTYTPYYSTYTVSSTWTL